MKVKSIPLFFCITFLCYGTGVLAQGDWTVLSPSNPPSPRAGHGIIPMPDGSAMMFGGGDDDQNLNNDLYSYRNNTWTSEPASKKPPARRNHASWYSNGKLYVHGGKTSSGQPTYDLWAYDLTKKDWDEIVLPPGSKPPAREGHLATVFPGGVILTGGKNGTGVSLRDTWDYYPNENRFQLIGICPIPMANHVGQLIGTTLWLFPGAEKTVKYDFSANTWTVGDGAPPLLGYSSSAAYVNETGESIITIFGGMKYDNTESNVVYEYNVNRLVLAERQQEMQFPLLFASSAALVGDGMRSQPAINVLFFGGISGGKCINTTFMFSNIPKQPGDLNGDGVFDLKDLILALKIISGVVNETVFLSADPIHNGIISTDDAVYMIQKLSGVRL